MDYMVRVESGPSLWKDSGLRRWWINLVVRWNTLTMILQS